MSCAPGPTLETSCIIALTALRIYFQIVTSMSGSVQPCWATGITTTTTTSTSRPWTSQTFSRRTNTSVTRPRPATIGRCSYQQRAGIIPDQPCPYRIRPTYLLLFLWAFIWLPWLTSLMSGSCESGALNLGLWIWGSECGALNLGFIHAWTMALMICTMNKYIA